MVLTDNIYILMEYNRVVRSSSGLNKQFDLYLKSRNVKIEFGPRDPPKDLEYMTLELEIFAVRISGNNLELL